VKAHGGRLAVEVLVRYGVDTMFTLSGGHLFVLYDGAVQNGGMRLIDARHEQTVVFAAEGYAKVTRRIGCAAITAGPGVTNGVSAMTSAWMNGSQIVVLAGRAPQGRWGSGSLQELDHIPIVASVTKRAATATSAASIVEEVRAACRAATTPHRGPAFVDIPLDAFGPEDVDLDPIGVEAVGSPGWDSGETPDGEAVARVAKLVSEAQRPVLLAGGDVYWARAEEPMRAFVEQSRVPTFVNGMGRGLLPADHELAFSRARSIALKQADLVLVAGTPLDFRLGFGRFGDAQVVHLCDAASQVAEHATLAASTAGDLHATFAALAVSSTPARNGDWVSMLRDDEQAKRAAEAPLLAAESDPIKPARVYGELRKRLDRDAIVIGDGGDFVSYAGKYVDSFEPGTFLDPGPFGCLGMGPGYALGAGMAFPDRQVVLMLGDGAIGFALGDFEALVRHGVNVVAIVGNNGIWGLEKHPMQALFGYDVVAELRPGVRYDEVVTALGGNGELVTAPGDIGPALDRAFSTPGVSLVNILTDPADAYPRSSNLA
jgi:thiamine pyrophosphate-dependent acetolactate synthase large subunit-like protein